MPWVWWLTRCCVAVHPLQARAHRDARARLRSATIRPWNSCLTWAQIWRRCCSGAEQNSSARYDSTGSLVTAVQQVQQHRRRQAQHQAALAQLIEQAQTARTAKEWLIVQGLCVQIMQIDRAHPGALAWMTEAAGELQRENQEELERRQCAKRYEEGETALAAGQWQAASEAFGEISAGNPDFRDVQQMLAQVRDELQRAQWYDEAIAYAEAQRWADASRVWIRVLHGRMDYHGGDAVARLLISTEGLVGQFDEAVARLTRETERRQDALYLFDQLAIAEEHGDWPKVMALAEQLIDGERRSAEAAGLVNGGAPRTGMCHNAGRSLAFSRKRG